MPTSTVSLAERDNSPGVSDDIAAATLEHLVIELLLSFKNDGTFGNEHRQQFLDTFLLMHKWFTTSIQFLRYLTNVRSLNVKDKDPSLQDYNNQAEHLVSSTPTHCTCSDSQIRARNNSVIASMLLDGYKSVHRLAVKSSHLGSQLQCMNDVICKSLDRDLGPVSGCDTMSHTHSLNSYLKHRSDTQCSRDIVVQRLERSSCFLLRYWMQQFPVHFDSDSQLREELENYREILAQTNPQLYQILDQFMDIPSYDWMRKVTIKSNNGTERCESQTKVSLVFQNLTAEELAKHITYIDYKACRRISFLDYELYTRTGSMEGNQRLERSVLLFNGLTQWVQLMILSKTTAKQRAAIIAKFIKVSQQLLKVRNYNSLTAVVGGLTHSSMARLHKTLSHLSSDSQKVLAELASLISSDNNFSSYRKLLNESSSSPFCIPIIGVHLKDLVAIHAALPDTVDREGEEGLINFRKMSQLSTVISTLVRLQDCTLPFQVNVDLIDTLKLAFDVFYSEEEIFELSLAREPRANGTPSTPSGPITEQQLLFSDWISGMKPPDKDTINKHVTNMVKAMFKNYDLDKDGMISIEEFETITSNFPFMETFCVLDVNDQGLLSETEVKKYFLLAKCNVLKNSYTHNFSETTYFRPSYCDHCSGLLWGLIKQGYKCKDCGINAHKSCKETVIIECKPKYSHSHKSQHPSSPSTSSISPAAPSTPELSKEPRFTFNSASIRKVTAERSHSENQTASTIMACRHRQSTATQTDSPSMSPKIQEKTRTTKAQEVLQPMTSSTSSLNKPGVVYRRHSLSLASRSELNPFNKS